MSLNDTVRAGVETAFNAADDFVSLAEYVVRTGAPVLDVATDTVSVASTTYPSVRMIRASLTAEEREASSVTVESIKVLVPASDLFGVTEPNETDTFTLHGVGYNVLNYRVVPGGSLFIIFAQRQ